MAIHVSMSGEQMLKKIEDTIGKHFHAGPVKFISSVMASFALARDLYIDRENFLLVDVGGEVTDLSMVKKGVLRESISFPFGRNFFTRGVAAYLNTSPGETNSLISLFKSGHAEKSVVKKLTQTLSRLETEWLGKFQESLAEISGDIAVPATIYLSVDREMADFFQKIIKSEQFSQYSLPEAKFEIIILSSELLHGAAAFEENTVREPSVIIDSIYINRFLTSTVPR